MREGWGFRAKKQYFLSHHTHQYTISPSIACRQMKRLTNNSQQSLRVSVCISKQEMSKKGSVTSVGYFFGGGVFLGHRYTSTNAYKNTLQPIQSVYQQTSLTDKRPNRERMKRGWKTSRGFWVRLCFWKTTGCCFGSCVIVCSVGYLVDVFQGRNMLQKQDEEKDEKSEKKKISSVCLSEKLVRVWEPEVRVYYLSLRE